MANIHQLFLLLKHGMFYLLLSILLKSMECTSVSGKIGTTYPQAIVSMKLMKFTVLCTPVRIMEEGKLRKS